MSHSSISSSSGTFCSSTKTAKRSGAAQCCIASQSPTSTRIARPFRRPDALEADHSLAKGCVDRARLPLRNFNIDVDQIGGNQWCSKCATTVDLDNEGQTAAAERGNPPRNFEFVVVERRAKVLDSRFADIQVNAV